MATKFGGRIPDQSIVIPGVKGHAGVSKGQPKVKLLRNAVWPLNLVGRTPDQSVTHCRGRRSCRGHPGSSLCVCVCRWGCVCVCPAMRFAMLRGIELKIGMGVGDGPTRFVGIFSKRPHLGSKVIQRSICLRNALWLPNLVIRTPD